MGRKDAAAMHGNEKKHFSSVKYQRMQRTSDGFIDIQFQKTLSRVPKKAIALAACLFIGGTVLIILASFIFAGFFDPKIHWSHPGVLSCVHRLAAVCCDRAACILFGASVQGSCGETRHQSPPAAVALAITAESYPSVFNWPSLRGPAETFTPPSEQRRSLRGRCRRDLCCMTCLKCMKTRRGLRSMYFLARGSI
ncbi:uncharacterized protein LOC144109453 isoform X1 [Amblyomma americanum]